jgi:uncharacterized protein (TIGR03435 family)
MTDDFENARVEPQVFRCAAARDDERIVVLGVNVIKGRIQSEIVAPFFAIGLVAFEIMDRRPHGFARALIRTDRVDRVAHHQQRLERNHNFVIFHIIANQHQQLSARHDEFSLLLSSHFCQFKDVQLAIMVFVGLLGLALQIQAQPAFEVASVKPSTSGFNGVRGGCHGIDSNYSPIQQASAPPLGRCVITDGRLSHLIFIAYGLRSIGQIKNAPDWVIAGTERFNIEAKAEDSAKTTQAQLLEMLQTLLADRFKLKFHRENQEVPGFGLVVAKNGPKLQEAKSEEVATNFGDAFKQRADGAVTFIARKYSMGMIADLISRYSPDPVMDETGLSGTYDFKLSWDETAGPSLFTAVQEQLGLRLNPRKVPVSFFMFDSAQRPTGN